MEKELDPDIIKATQASLGKYVKRPPLTEKLLKKPPFRFLHDIVTTVLKTTGFFEGLFDEEELVSENIKDRETKIQFLGKVISVTGFATGKLLSVKPSKIVAGQEADKTNELLQCLAQALDKKINSDEAVKKFKEGSALQQTLDKKTKEISKTKKANDKKIASKSTEKLPSNKKDQPLRGPVKTETEKIVKTRQKDNVLKNEPPLKKQTKTTAKQASLEKKPSRENNLQKQIDKIDQNKLIDDISSTRSHQTNDENDPNLFQQELAIEDSSSNVEPALSHSEQSIHNTCYIIENQLNSSLSSQDLMDVENEKVAETHSLETKIEIAEVTKIFDKQAKKEQILSISPLKNKALSEDNTQNSHKNIDIPEAHSLDYEAKENVKENDAGQVTKPSVKNTNNSHVTRPSSVRPSSSRPGAPRLRDKHENIITESENIIVGKVNIIAENATIEEEEDSNVIIIEQDSAAIKDDQEQSQLTSSNPHGHLVQQILDSQKEYSQIAGKTEIEWQFGAQKAREAVNQEIEQLRYNLQGLSRVANPLGKLLDHIQEDVEVMRQELQQWTKTYEESSKELSKQKALNEESLFPFRTKVKQLQIDIEEKHDKINDLKVVIHKNSSRIEKLLSGGDVQ